MATPDVAAVAMVVGDPRWARRACAVRTAVLEGGSNMAALPPLPFPVSFRNAFP